MVRIGDLAGPASKATVYSVPDPADPRTELDLTRQDAVEQFFSSQPRRRNTVKIDAAAKGWPGFGATSDPTGDSFRD